MNILQLRDVLNQLLEAGVSPTTAAAVEIQGRPGELTEIGVHFGQILDDPSPKLRGRRHGEAQTFVLLGSLGEASWIHGQDPYTDAALATYKFDLLPVEVPEKGD